MNPKYLLFLIGSIVITLTYVHLSQRMQLRGRVKLTILTVNMLSILLWPLIYEQFLKENAYKKSTMISLLWPIVLIALDTYLLKYHRLEDMNSRKGVITMDANAMCSMAFALSSIMQAQKDKCCSDLFIYGVIGCIIFVMPNPTVPSHTLENTVIETVQQICLTYSTGFLIAAAMMLNSSSNNTIKS